VSYAPATAHKPSIPISSPPHLERQESIRLARVTGRLVYRSGSRRTRARRSKAA